MVVAVKVAQVPVVYQVPPLMIQPFCLPPLVTNRIPLPEKGAPGALVGAVLALVVVPGGEGPVPVFGRYLIPVAGQLELAPAGLHLCLVQRSDRAIRDRKPYLDWLE